MPVKMQYHKKLKTAEVYDAFQQNLKDIYRSIFNLMILISITVKNNLFDVYVIPHAFFPNKIGFFITDLVFVIFL